MCTEKMILVILDIKILTTIKDTSNVAIGCVSGQDLLSQLLVKHKLNMTILAFLNSFK